ncbi:hypothetical protein AUR64_02770 [Haloprofundus marisrubri]|uniref:Uncharacterized protein n=2 Tax=Haloprofundus marisrubri TaxID=1514971 RepID=A0A0W1R376_9EURY|nr:hypothetical protein AUR64_02770 [Haloprofundus marisrubri]
MGSIAFESRGEPMTRLHWAAVGLAGITAGVHLYLYSVQGFLPFLLAGLGFLGAVVLLVAGVNRRLLYAVGVPFTASQIAVWFVQGMPEFALGVADKTVQVALIGILVYLFVAERTAAKDVVEPEPAPTVVAR